MRLFSSQASVWTRFALLGLILLSDPLGAVEEYRFFEVTRRPSWEPSITDLGEVVFLAVDGDGHPNAFSSRAGQLTFSTTGLLRFPRAGEEGELVYSDRKAPGSRFEIWSSRRGQISVSGANLPSLSSSGEICFVVQEETGTSIWSSTRGRLVELRSHLSTSCDINATGEVVYRDYDAAGRPQVFSTVSGQLTSGDHGLLGSPAINDLGEVIYVESGEIHSIAKGQITSTGGEVGFFVDLNNRGDMVFPLNRRDSYRIVLATRRPDLFPELRRLEERIDWVGPDIEIEIAIAPDRGRFELPGRRLGTVPVVLLSTQKDRGEVVDFNALEVDELSVRFGPDRATIIVRSMAQRRDVDGDGDTDLVLWFRTETTGLGCKSKAGSLSGRTREGRRFTGSAEIEQPLC